MLGLGEDIDTLTLFVNFIERMGGIGLLIVVVGSIIISRSNPSQVLEIDDYKQPTIKMIIQIIVGAGLVLFGIYVIYESLTLQLPGPT